MSPAPLLSIVIPTHERPAMLAALLAALPAQIADLGTPGACEVIVVDNAASASAAPVVAAHVAACGAGHGAGVRHLHEPRPGVAHARNTGVAAAAGGHVLFIDDDETPAPGWLAAFAARARAGDDAAFGPVAPVFEVPPEAHLAALVTRVFSRDLGLPTGTDISDRRAYLGSGNALFHRTRALGGPAPFDPRFNAGGEDVALLRRLVEARGLRLRWCAEGAVHEHVPAARMGADFLARRRFRDGQLRCLVEAEAGGLAGPARVGFWMAAGAAQATLNGAAALALAPFDRPGAEARAIRARGGLGKLLWWRAAEARGRRPRGETG